MLHNWNWWYLAAPALFGLGVYIAVQKGTGQNNYGIGMRKFYVGLAMFMFAGLLILESWRGITEVGYQADDTVITAWFFAAAVVIAYGFALYYTMEFFEFHYWSKEQKCFVKRVDVMEAYVTAVMAVARDDKLREQRRQTEIAAETRRHEEALRKAEEARKQADRPAQTRAQQKFELLKRQIEHPETAFDQPTEDPSSEIEVTVRIPQTGGVTQLVTMSLTDFYALTQNILRWNRQMRNIYGDSAKLVALPKVGWEDDELDVMEQVVYDQQAELQSAILEQQKTSGSEFNLEELLKDFSETDAQAIRDFLEARPDVKAIAAENDRVVRLDVDPKTGKVRVRANLRGAV